VLTLIYQITDLNANLQSTLQPLNHAKHDDHLEGLKEFAKELQEALRHSKPRMVRYKEVHVLLIYWKDSDIGGMEQEVDGIENVFRDKYHYTTARCELPSDSAKGAEFALEERLLSFRKNHTEPNSLFVIYYNGHGIGKDDYCYWTP
jgi:hypothetical protein